MIICGVGYMLKDRIADVERFVGVLRDVAARGSVVLTYLRS